MKHIWLLSWLTAIIPAALEAQVNIQTNGGNNYKTIQMKGSTEFKYDIVFIGDGFTTADQTLFNSRVDDAVNALYNLEPYKSNICAFNIWRVNVLSTDSGIDHPANNISKNTALDCRFGNPANQEAERCVRSDSPAKCYEAAGYAPAYDAVFVLVNDSQWGGCAGGGLVFASIAPGFQQIITHELGHNVGHLADEYDCYVCDGSDANLTYSGSEFAEANVTNNTNRNTTKWRDLIAPLTPIPTTSGANTVGLWEGGNYYAKGVYRPQQTCQMKNSAQPFCAVCFREMRSIMNSKCTLCDRYPVICTHRYDNLVWRDALRWKFPWPWPPCLSCPPDRPDYSDVVYEIRFEEKILLGSEVIVRDDTGEVLAQGGVQKNGDPLVVRFKGNRFKSYDVEFVSGKPQAEKLSLHPVISVSPQ